MPYRKSFDLTEQEEKAMPKKSFFWISFLRICSFAFIIPLILWTSFPFYAHLNEFSYVPATAWTVVSLIYLLSCVISARVFTPDK